MASSASGQELPNVSSYIVQPAARRQAVFERSLGGLRYSDDGYAALAREVAGIAQRHAWGRLVFMLEGGYAPVEMSGAVAGMLAVVNDAQRARERVG